MPPEPFPPEPFPPAMPSTPATPSTVEALPTSVIQSGVQAEEQQAEEAQAVQQVVAEIATGGQDAAS